MADTGRMLFVNTTVRESSLLSYEYTSKKDELTVVVHLFFSFKAFFESSKKSSAKPKSPIIPGRMGNHSDSTVSPQNLGTPSSIHQLGTA